MFSIHLYTLSKRDNSTKRPSGDGREMKGNLRDSSGLVNPTVSFNFGITNDPSQYNYAYIAKFGRYYFIEEWYFKDALWNAVMKVDVLATYKSEIGNSNLYVMRSSAEQNENIVDLLYPSRTGCAFRTTQIANPWFDNIIYVVGVVSKRGELGSLTYYAMSEQNVRTMCENLIDNTVNTNNGFSLDDCSMALQLSLVDPLQYIKSCVALPVAAGDISGADSVSSNVYAFSWDTGAIGFKIPPRASAHKDLVFNIIKHPDTGSRGNYVNSAPFAKLTLTVPPFGCIDIDTSVTCTASELTARVFIDAVTGRGIMEIICNGIVMNRVEAQMGVPISLSSVTRDYISGATSAVGAVGSAIGGFMTGQIGSGIIGAGLGIGNAVEALCPRANTIGTNGGYASTIGGMRLDHQFFHPIADDNAHNGRPLCAKRTIKDLGGYMIIQDGDVPINGTSEEDSKVRTYLETGFYYE